MNKAVLEIQAKMKTWTDAGIELAYNSGYERGKEDAEKKHNSDLDYKDGLEDGRMEAWECARKLCQSEKYGGLEEHCAEIFNRQDTFDVFDYSASEAIAKIKEYEQKQTDTKEGHWKESDIPNEKYVCSECGGACWYYDYQGNLGKSNYCPNCGARMWEEKAND